MVEDGEEAEGSRSRLVAAQRGEPDLAEWTRSAAAVPLWEKTAAAVITARDIPRSGNDR